MGTAGPQMTRRTALRTVGTIAGVLYGETVVANGQKALLLALDDVSAITVRYRGRTVSVSPAAIVEALAVKEEAVHG